MRLVLSAARPPRRPRGGRSLRRGREAVLVRCGCATRSSTTTSSAGHAENYDLDPALLAAVIYRESKFDADARSSSGAIGLMQLLPDTAEGIALHTGGVEVRGRRPLRPGDQRPLRLVLPPAAPAQVRRRAARAGRLQRGPGQRGRVDRERGEEIPFPETREYVGDVLEAREVYARAYADELGLGD